MDRHEGAQGKGALQFSIANLVKPGTFDLAAIKTFYTPGITLFMQLPGQVRADKTGCSCEERSLAHRWGSLLYNNRLAWTV